MRILVVFVSLVYYSSDCMSQVNWVEDWNKSTLELAKAKGTLKMNSVEKEVIFYCNLVRISPKKFLQTIVPKYVNSRKLNNSSYLISLQRDLKRSKKLPPLKANNDLYEVAKVHAVSSGIKGSGEILQEVENFLLTPKLTLPDYMHRLQTATMFCKISYR